MSRNDPDKPEKLVKSPDEWRTQLSPEQYRVCRESGTEPPFSGRYHHCTRLGIYRCACCRQPLFDGAAKFDSGTGWPSFVRPITAQAIDERADESHSMRRTEVTCRRCDAHLGHVFNDGPRPTGLRYCINSVALELDEAPSA